ncbi:MAG: dockerin type I domain-containing protein [Clostridia bacterium]
MKKKFLLVILLISAVVVSTSIYGTTLNYILGDINNDGKVTLDDYKIVLDTVAGKRGLNNKQTARADVDGDKNITAMDADLIYYVVTGKVNGFPAEKKDSNWLVYGDLNFDGVVTSGDAMVVLQAAAGSRTLGTLQAKRADVDGDGVITDDDAQYIQQKDVQLITKFPVEDPTMVINILGDINNDGKVTLDDYKIVLDTVAGKITLNNRQAARADVDGDKNITAMDADLIYYVVTGKVNGFPAAKKDSNWLVYGDVNFDGIVNSKDAAIVRRAVAQWITLGPLQTKRADVDGDGVMTEDDAQYMREKVAENITKFPVEDPTMVINICGDINSNGRITLDDYKMALDTVAGKITLNNRQAARADVDGDKNITAMDADLIYYVVTGKVNGFPAAKKDSNWLVYGDVNFDGVVTSGDATVVLQVAAGSRTLGPLQTKRADVDGDGVITEDDAQFILQKEAQLITKFPVEDPTMVINILGDVNNNGKVTLDDYKIVLDKVEGKRGLNNRQTARADVDGDKNITAMDADLIYYVVTGKVNGFPAEKKDSNWLVYGDVNFDGVVTSGDAILVMQVASGSRTLGTLQAKRADVDGDGIITDDDAQFILQKEAQLITKFPIEDPTMVINILGDVNNNGKVTLDDYKIVLDTVAGKRGLNNKQTARADVDGDKNITAMDADLIYYVVTGKVNGFPAAKKDSNWLVYGDVNFDGVVTSGDATVVLQVAAGSRTLGPLQTKRADVDGDGVITEDDAQFILQKEAQLITKFPVEV